MSRPYDATLKQLLDAFGPDWVGWVGPRLGLPAGTVAEPMDADLSTISAEADKVFRLFTPYPAIVQLEVQTSWDDTLPQRLMLYNVLLENRHALPVYSVVLLLRRQATASTLTGSLHRAFPDGRAYLDFRYEIIRLWELPADNLLASGLGTLPLALLTDDAAARLPEVMDRMAQRLAKESVPPPIANTLWTAGYILLGMRYDKPMIDRLFSGVTTMKESTTYQGILAEGIEKGIEKGIAKGLIEAHQEDLLLLLEERFGSLPAELIGRIKAVTDVKRLKAALRKVPHLKSLEEFEL